MKRMILFLMAAAAFAAVSIVGTAQTLSAFDSYSTDEGQFFDWGFPLFIDDDKPAPSSFSAAYYWIYKPPVGNYAKVPGYNDLSATFPGSTTSHTFPYPPASSYVGGVLSFFCIEITTVYSANDTSTAPLLCPQVSVPDDDS